MTLAHRRVHELMRTDLITLAPDETLDLGQDLMRLGRLRHVPVVDEERLVGMISDRDLFSRSLSRALDLDGPSLRGFLRSIPVAAVMNEDVVTIGPEAPLSEAARRLNERRVGALPVVDDSGRLRGLITVTDLLAAAYLDPS